MLVTIYGVGNIVRYLRDHEAVQVRPPDVLPKFSEDEVGRNTVHRRYVANSALDRRGRFQRLNDDLNIRTQASGKQHRRKLILYSTSRW